MGSPRAACGYGGLSAPYRRRDAVASHRTENRLAATGTHAGGAKLLSIYQRIAKYTRTGHAKALGIASAQDNAIEVGGTRSFAVGISNFNDIKVGDILECFKMEKTAALEPVSQADRGRPEAAEARRN